MAGDVRLRRSEFSDEVDNAQLTLGEQPHDRQTHRVTETAEQFGGNSQLDAPESLSHNH